MNVQWMWAGLCVLAIATCAAPGPAARAETAGSDAFARLVAQAEVGKPDVDFKALRLAWLTSEQRKRRKPLVSLVQEMRSGARASDAARVRRAAEQIIAVDYTNMLAHKYRHQACVVLKDDPCADHEHFVEFGLLHSIVDNGDGRGFERPWTVISVDEEYVLMEIGGWRPGEQSLVIHDGRPFDVMKVKNEDGSDETLYFDISAFFGHELD